MSNFGIITSEIIIRYLKFARRGDPIAQYNLACCYQYGKEIEQDYFKAFEWYYKSANNGHAKSQHILGDTIIMEEE
jgi:TPR repeat protein